ncbi:unnamed protein product [Victoria cruziana]
MIGKVALEKLLQSFKPVSG